MKRHDTIEATLLALFFAGLALPAAAQHGHLNAGAVGQNQGDKLSFANGDLFAASSGYVKELPLASTGTYAGYYEGGITLTALPTTVANGGPAAGASAPGSFVMVGITSVSGPAGGSFAMWEEGATSPTFSYSVGYDVTSPTSLWALSDASSGAGVLGGDPYGHLHGRRFTATEPGLYTVEFRLFDTSVNGTGGAPIHTPSAELPIAFNAVPEPSVVTLLAAGGLGLLLVRRGRR
ncbi:MAG: PEP-CTERM sorting domain-containing protein [Verrucomicrobiales bacterium]|nr:PEP-CTERM sorting domain-containing protein [Verrucomicrobiales bacterium]